VFVAADGQAQFINNRRVSSFPKSSNQHFLSSGTLSRVNRAANRRVLRPSNRFVKLTFYESRI
jgi:hypothetical protein